MVYRVASIFLAETKAPGRFTLGAPGQVQIGQSFYTLQSHTFDPGDVLLAGHVMFSTRHASVCCV